jgi:hypothetical protein
MEVVPALVNIKVSSLQSKLGEKGCRLRWEGTGERKDITLKELQASRGQAVDTWRLTVVRMECISKHAINPNLKNVSLNIPDSPLMEQV